MFENMDLRKSQTASAFWTRAARRFSPASRAETQGDLQRPVVCDTTLTH
jgi:hypothetical protein